jgi:hypothetical protein
MAMKGMMNPGSARTIAITAVGIAAAPAIPAAAYAASETGGVTLEMAPK